jgi:hypothetical protein
MSEPNCRRCAGSALVALAVAATTAGCRREAEPARPASPPPQAPASRTGSIPPDYGLRPAERQVVESFLRRHPELRLPTDDDRRVSASGEGDIRHLYGVYHPYFVRGDLNDDGILDFVMGFVRRDSAASIPWFTVVVFAGKDSGASGPSFGPETFLERDITLAAGDISIDRDAIVITPDLDDETTRRYRWDPARRSYVFVRDDDSEAEPPDVSRT